MAAQRRWMLALALAGSLMPAVAADGDAPAEPQEQEKFTLHGEVRFRGQFESNYQDFNDNGGIYDPTVPILIPDDSFDYFPYRARIGVEGMLMKDLVGYAEVQVGGVAGLDAEARSTMYSNSSNVDLYQAYIHWNQIGNANLSLRLGRQELVYGNELFFGNLDYYNGLSFDGARLRYEGERMAVDIWWARTNETFESDADTDVFNVGIGGKTEGRGDWSFYIHDIRQDQVSGTNRVDLTVFGFRTTRMDGGSDRFLWNIEGAWQDGRIGNPLDPATGITYEDNFIAAWGGEGAFGYNWNNEANDHRVYGHLYWASGDKTQGDRDDNNFQTLFQDYHERLGRADIVQGTNVISAGLAYEANYGERHEAGMDLMTFVIARPADTSTTLASISGQFDGFSIPATVLNTAPGITPAEDDLGQEIDLWYQFFYSKNLSFALELSTFFPGDAIKQVSGGFDDPAMDIAGQVRLRF